MFKVGQRVVCVKDHSEGIVKEGQEFKVLDVKEPHCNCKPQVIDVGFRRPANYEICNICKKISPINNDTWWLSSLLFAPIQEYGDSMSIAMELIQDMERVDKPEELIVGIGIIKYLPFRKK